MLSDSLSQSLIVLNQNLKNCLIKQVFSYPHYLVLALHQGRKRYLYLSRGKSAAAILLDNEKLERITRHDDKYVHVFRSFLKGLFVKQITIDENLGMIALVCEKGQCRSVLHLFYKSEGVYFLLSSGLADSSKYLASWHGNLEEFSTSKGAETAAQAAIMELNKISGKCQKLSIEMSNLSYGQMWDKLLARQTVRKEKKIVLKKDKIKNDIADLRGAIEKMEAALRDNMEFGEIYECLGHRVKFPRQITEWKKREMVFNKLKALKRGKAIQEKRFDAIESHEDNLKAVPIVRSWNPVWHVKAAKKESSVTETLGDDVIEVNSFKNTIVKIGKNENGNDFLLTSWSKSNDLWVHLHDYPSAHAVIRFGDSNREQLFDLLDDVARVLKRFAGLTHEKVSVIYTERRWVKPIKGNKGKVKLSKFHLYLPRK